MVNVCDAGTKDFAEFWEITHLKIRTYFPSDKQIILN